MRAVVQRVANASVTVDGKVVGACGNGLLILLGVEKGDTEEDLEVLAQKLAKLRIFSDENGKMNRSVVDIEGELLILSNFTLCADCRHGNRPDYFGAEAPSEANCLYEAFIARMKTLTNRPVAAGIFGADMKVSLLNDGPVTLTLDSAVLLRKKQP